MDFVSDQRVDDDVIQPFKLETNAARGRLVRLGPLADRVLSRQEYPEPVATMLGETLALAALVSSAFKFDGIFTLQAKGDGPITTLVADITADGEMRGYAQFDEDRLADSDARANGDTRSEHPVPRLLGNGHLAFTVDQGPNTDRYQGIVELTGATLADCAHTYFRQSEQLQAAVKLAARRGRTNDDLWRAGGLMVQRLPGVGPVRVSGDPEDDDAEDRWRRALILMGSCTGDELLDSGLHPHGLLYRLFREDGVRVFEPTPLVMRCRCSEGRVETMLRAFPREEIEDLLIGDRVVVTCEFCGAQYDFDMAALDQIYGA